MFQFDSLHGGQVSLQTLQPKLPHLEFIVGTLVFECDRLQGGQTKVPASQHLEDNVHALVPARLNVVFPVGPQDAENTQRH